MTDERSIESHDTNTAFSARKCITTTSCSLDKAHIQIASIHTRFLRVLEDLSVVRCRAVDGLAVKESPSRGSLQYHVPY